MDIFLIILGVILILVGFVGCFLPVLPGPTLVFASMLLLQLTKNPPFEFNFLLLWGGITVGTIGADYLLPPLATKKFGGSKKGIFGSVIGLLIGIVLFAPFGIIFGPVIGAYLGEMLDGKNANDAVRPALGSLIGFLTSIVLKLTVASFMTYHFIIAIIAIIA